MPRVCISRLTLNSTVICDDLANLILPTQRILVKNVPAVHVQLHCTRRMDERLAEVYNLLRAL